MSKGRSHFRRYHGEKHSSRRRRRRRRDERHRLPHRRHRDGNELSHDLPQHPDDADDRVPTNDGSQGSGYHPDSELQVLVDTPRCGTSTTSVPMSRISEAIVRGVIPQFEFKPPPPKQTQEELFGSFVVYCWYLGLRTVGTRKMRHSTLSSAVEVNGGVW
jgi:hypothetical protein